MGRKKGLPAAGGVVAARRQEAGLTQVELAARAEVSLAAVRKVEAGRTADLETLDQVARALGLRAQDLIARPAGPVRVAERFTGIAVAPVPRRGYAVRHGGTTRVVETDNRAELEYRLAVAANSPPGECLLQYTTTGGGWVGDLAADPALPNLAPAFLRGLDEREGATLHHQFAATPGLRLRVVYTLLKGFEAGRRDAHTHLFPHRHGYVAALVRYRLDLSAYRAAGWRLLARPTCHYHPEDVDCGAVCGRRRLLDPLDPAAADDQGWVWEWRVRDCSSGVMDLDWNGSLGGPPGR